MPWFVFPTSLDTHRFVAHPHAMPAFKKQVHALMQKNALGKIQMTLDATSQGAYEGASGFLGQIWADGGC